jgi:pimeloyl-ACP methyl ester carboxylesterase
MHVLEGPTYAAEKNTIQVDGRRVHYRRSGTGPPLVMIHGLVGSSRQWHENIEALAAIRTVYAPDSANMGESERRIGVDPGIDAQVARIIAWMDAVGIPAADFVGHSHGSAILIVLAARHPERVRRLALFCPPNSYCDLGGPQVRFYATWLGGLFARRIIPLMPRFMWRRSLARVYGDPTRMTEAAFEGSIAGLDRATIIHIVDVMRGWQADMAQVDASLPALDPSRTALFWGDLDRAVSILSGRKLAEMFGFPLIVIEGTGHLPFLERPEETNKVLLRWLNR